MSRTGAITSWHCSRCGTEARVRHSAVCPVCATPGPLAPSPRHAPLVAVEVVVITAVALALAAAWITVWLHR